jgi:flagellar basal body-associated protein FliL
MSEEQESTNDGTWSGLKKTLIGTLSTAILGAGTWVTTHFMGGSSEEKESPKTEQAAPAAAPVVINLSNNNTNQQKQTGGGTTTIIKEKVVEKPVENPAKKSETEDAPW